MSTLRIGWKNTNVVLDIFHCCEETMTKATYKCEMHSFRGQSAPMTTMGRVHGSRTVDTVLEQVLRA